MISPLLNWYFRQRYDELLEQTEKAVYNQEVLFDYLIESGRVTDYGLKHGFKSIRNYQDFASQVPLNEYEDLSPWIEKSKLGEWNQLWPGESTWFAKSSGTTSNSAKYIPISYESLEETHFQGGRDMLTVYCARNPETRIFQGKGLFIGGSYKANKENPRSFSGDLSAVLMSHLPSWANIRSTPDPSIALMDSWEEKVMPMAKATLNENVVSITGVPTWVIVLFNKIFEISGKSDIREIWPNLELFFHGGVNFRPYREQFSKLISGNMNYLETYNASEGFFGLQFDPDSPEFTLLTHHGVFYEFIPKGGNFSDIIPLWEVIPGVEYAIVITTNAGLWRYNLGDTVRFSSTSPYRFSITGRTKLFINAFGEELVIENADEAISKTCTITGASISDYTAAPIYMSDNQGGHEWLIEFEKLPENLNVFTEILDRELKKANGDYEAKRKGDLAMHLPVIRVVPKGIFQAWLKSKDKLGVQNKIPRLSNNREFVDEILGIFQPGRSSAG